MYSATHIDTMAILDFRSWRITSDSEGWTLGHPKIRMNKKKQQEIYLASPSYYATLQAALQGLLERELKESDAATAAEILSLLKQLKMEIKELVAT